jgi:lactate dehydrogenase-like 2-hydroxyacid dehydrogenase
MTKDAVLLPVPLPKPVQDGLATTFDLIRLYETPNRDALIAQVAPYLRFIATALPVIADGNKHPITADFIARFPKLEIIGNIGVGYDNIDAQAAAARGVIVTNTPDVLTDETADTAFGLLLCAVRQLPQADRYLRDGKWLQDAFPLTASLRNRTMGIVGLGRIGKAIAKRGEAFGLKIAYHSRTKQDVAYPFFAKLEDLARACDILVVATPGGAQTNHLIDARILDALGPDGILINIARGSVVDEDALIAALKERRILTAGLDVFAREPQVPEELIALPHVVLLPHVGSATHSTRAAMGQLLVDNLLSYAKGNGPLTAVAETPWPKVTKKAN